MFGIEDGESLKRLLTRLKGVAVDLKREKMGERLKGGREDDQSPKKATPDVAEGEREREPDEEPAKEPASTDEAESTAEDEVEPDADLASVLRSIGIKKAKKK